MTARNGLDLRKQIARVYEEIARTSALRPVLYVFPMIKKIVFLDQKISGTNAFVTSNGVVVICTPNFIERVDEYYQSFSQRRIAVASPAVAFLMYLLAHEATHLVFFHYQRVESLLRHNVPKTIAMLAAELECSAIVSQMLPLPPWASTPQDYGFEINASLEKMALALRDRIHSSNASDKLIEELEKAWESLAVAIEKKERGGGESTSDDHGRDRGRSRDTKTDYTQGRDKEDYSSQSITTTESETSEETSGNQGEDRERGGVGISGKQQEGETEISVDQSLIDKINQAMEKLTAVLPQGEQSWGGDAIDPLFLLPRETSAGTPSVFLRVPSVFSTAALRHLARISDAFAGWEALGADIEVSTDPIGNAIRIISQRIAEVSRRNVGMTWRRPSRRMLRLYVEQRLYLPDRGRGGTCIGIVVDTSGSMWEIVDQAIRLAYGTRGDEVWVVPCDTMGYTPYRAKERKSRVKGGGGTYLWNGVKTLYDRQRFPFLPEKFSSLIIISDGYSNLPSEEEVRSFWNSLVRRNIPIPSRYFIALIHYEGKYPDLSFWTKMGFTSEMVVISALR